VLAAEIYSKCIIILHNWCSAISKKFVEETIYLLSLRLSWCLCGNSHSVHCARAVISISLGSHTRSGQI